MKVLGIIPARSGSKGIKNKNMQLLGGKTLVQRAADTAISSGILDRIIVNTDDDAIIESFRSHPIIEVPFKRPQELASDAAVIADAIAHLLGWLRDRQNYIPDAFMLLEPTSPLRTEEDLRTALKQFLQSGKSCLIGVSEPQQHPSNMIVRTGDAFAYCQERKADARGRQDFHETWFINGAIYITQTAFFNETRRIYDLNACALYVVPSDRAFDINTPLDLALVRAHIHSINEEEHYV
jgi:CMP-N,N'-diacetyllegionaminic acid synthase